MLSSRKLNANAAQAKAVVVRTTAGILRGSTKEMLTCSWEFPTLQLLSANFAGDHHNLSLPGRENVMQPNLEQIVRNQDGVALRDQFRMAHRKIACFSISGDLPLLSQNSKLPVMVWIHGGGFTGGAGSQNKDDGNQFARQGVILVTINYRLGRLGHFAFPALSEEHPEEPKGSYAFMDQIAALKWVQQNIESFGGDPKNVTIFGFSAGGVSIHSLLIDTISKRSFPKGNRSFQWWQGWSSDRQTDQ